MKFLFRILLLALAPLYVQAAGEPRWQDWSPQSFSQAKSQDKFVFLYLEAVWCHWCHVMQAETFTDAQVLDRLQQNYVSVRVDHDAHPGLANRYRAWGWPALIFMSPDGTEIVKRAGYIGPEPFARLLDAIVADPSPEIDQRPLPAPAVSALLTPELRRTLQKRHRQTYDKARGGLDLVQKFLDPDSVEYSLLLAAEGDREQRRRVLQTLDASMALIDPVWGGMYQYSTGGRWDRPHYEKIMRSQYRALRSYALAYGYFQRDADRRSAVAIRDYLLTFLRGPEGAFYVSQDADLVKGQKAHDYFALNDKQRRARGMPAIDKHRYAQANGRAIEALAYWYEVSGDRIALDAALRAANWVLENRRLKQAGFQHGQDSAGSRFLGDNLAMTRALLQLYRVTAERKWLGLATATADYIGANFKGRVGFNTAANDAPPPEANADYRGKHRPGPMYESTSPLQRRRRLPGPCRACHALPGGGARSTVKNYRSWHPARGPGTGQRPAAPDSGWQ